MADEVKAALTVGNIPAAERLAIELSDDVARHGKALRLAELEAVLPADGPNRIEALVPVAKAAYAASDYAKAETYARELLTFAQEHTKDDPNYGNAVFYGNMVFGRVALGRDNNIAQAKASLIASGRTPGSRTLMSFGPNMNLAKDLLETGERDTVIQFFEECRIFWQMRGRKLDEWTETVKGCCRIPHFGPNLLY